MRFELFFFPLYFLFVVQFFVDRACTTLIRNSISILKNKCFFQGTKVPILRHWAYLCNLRKKSCFFKFQSCVGLPLGSIAEFPPLSSFLRRNHLIKHSLHHFFRFLISKHLTWQRQTREACQRLLVFGNDNGNTGRNRAPEQASTL